MPGRQDAANERVRGERRIGQATQGRARRAEADALNDETLVSGAGRQATPRAAREEATLTLIRAAKACAAGLFDDNSNCDAAARLPRVSLSSETRHSGAAQRMQRSDSDCAGAERLVQGRRNNATRGTRRASWSNDHLWGSAEFLGWEPRVT